MAEAEGVKAVKVQELDQLGSAVGTVLLVYSLARVGRLVPLTTLILAGVAVGAFASALTSYLMLRSDDQIYRAISFMQLTIKA